MDILLGMKTITPSIFSSFSGITAAFTTRHGGISKIPYDSANLAFHVGDDPGDVLKNHDILAQTLKYERNRLIHMRQIHSDRIVAVDERFDFETPPECDALITDTPHLPLMVMSADCTGILIYDPIAHAAGAVHAGRAGALSEILPKTLRTMEQRFGSKLQDFHIVLGPSIHGCCYEINEAIALETQTKGYASALRRNGETVFLDVNTILMRQLQEYGIDQSRIDVIDHCTACRNDDYFSYRADRQKTGRIAGIICLR